ncbi:MAG: zinc-binding dehydrogenase, partial [Thermodesulfobacteriota bacterium]
HDDRLKIAKKYGADTTINSSKEDPNEKIKEETDGRGADVVIEGMGTTTSLQSSIQLVRAGGTVSFIELFYEPFPMNMTDFFLRNLNLRVGVAPSRGYASKLLSIVDAKKLDPTQVVYSLPLSQAAEGYKLMDQRKEGAFKVVLSPQYVEET